MATRFDQLESDTIPPALGRAGRLNPVDPSVDTFRQRFAPFSSDPVGDYIEQQPPPGRPVMPGTRERFLDPSKVIAGPMPTPDTPTEFPVPKGFTPIDESKEFPVPKGFTPVDEPKLQRFLKNVEPKGPISGLIGLVRTAGEAAQGQRPDLLTNPENAIPEAVTGALAGTSARALRAPIEPNAASMVRGAPPPTPRPAPLQLEYKPDQSAALAAAKSAAKRADKQEALDFAAHWREHYTNEPPIIPEAQQGQVSPILPKDTIREFNAVRKGVELKDRLNPESPSNLSAKEQAMQSAIEPHIKSINTVTARTAAPIAALEAALPSLQGALSTPGKAASVANWVRVYERAARAKFSPEAKASLDLATRNLNNNLGTDLTLSDVLKGP